MSSKKQKSKNLFIQGTILALAGILTKVIGFAYRIPMVNLMGSDGNGVYSVAFSIYNIVLMLSSYSLPLAVSKLVSARLAMKQYNNSYRVFKDSMSNFIFATHPDYDIVNIFEELRKRDIYVRHFNGERIKDYLRITIGTDEEMKTLINTIKEIVAC